MEWRGRSLPRAASEHRVARRASYHRDVQRALRKQYEIVIIHPSFYEFASYLLLFVAVKVESGYRDNIKVYWSVKVVVESRVLSRSYLAPSSSRVSTGTS